MNIEPNQEQIKDGLRWIISAFGGVLAGWFAHEGYLSTEQVLSIINSPAFLSISASIIAGIIGIWSRNRSNMVAATDALPGVKGVVTADTPDGVSLAKSIPSETVVSAGTDAAVQMAK